MGAGGGVTPPAPPRGMGERCKLPDWAQGSGAKPQKICKFRIIKLQKNKEFHSAEFNRNSYGSGMLCRPCKLRMRTCILLFIIIII